MTVDTEMIREKKRATMKAMTAELADYAEEGGMSSVDADQLRAQILGIYEAALAALGRVEEREWALTEALNRASLVIEALADRNTLLTDGEWAGVVSFRTAARAAASVAAGSGEERE